MSGFTERDIHLALDGELPAEKLRDFNAWLDANPAMKQKADRFDADRQRLTTALGYELPLNGVAVARLADRLHAVAPVASLPAQRREGGAAA